MDKEDRKMVINLKYKNEIAWQNINESVYIFELVKRNVIILENIAKDFWLKIDKLSFEDIIIALSNTYNVDIDIIREDFIEFAMQLQQDNVIEILYT